MHRRALLGGLAGLPLLAGPPPKAVGRIAYIRDGNVWTARSDGGERTQLTRTGRDSYPAWSRDGSRLAFLRRDRPEGDGEFGRLYVMRADGSQLRRLTAHLCTRPRWSPIADEIATVGSPEPDQLRLLFLDPLGKPAREPIPLEKLVQPPPWGWMSVSDWHPAGKLLSFRVMGHLTRDTLIAEPTATGLRRVYDLSHLPQLEEDEVSAFFWRPGHEEAAAISAPGVLALRRLGREAYTRTLWLCKPDGMRIRELYRSKLLDFNTLTWAPDGGSVVAESGGVLLRIDIEAGDVRKLWPGEQPVWALDPEARP